MSDTAHAYFTAKLCLVVFNVGRIIQRLVVFGFSLYEDGYYKDIEPLSVNGTVITRYTARLPLSLVVFTLIMFTGLHMLGVIGAIKENRRCLYTYATICLFLNMISLFAPMGFNPAMFIIYLVMIILAIGFGIMLKQRDDRQRLYSQRINQSIQA